MNPYNLDESKQELIQLEAIFNAQVDIQTVLQILIEKEICTREEIQQHRERVKKLPKYKATDDYIQQTKQGLNYASDNPQEYLKELLKNKMNGNIK